VQLEKLRPEFRSSLDTLTKFVFERARPKQVGATMMTGPVLIGITESYLDALNHGAVPTISSSWQVSLSIIKPRLHVRISYHKRNFLMLLNYVSNFGHTWQ